MESTRGRETSGPSVGLWTRKSREKWGPSGQHTPQSSHRPPRDSTIVGSPGREAVAVTSQEDTRQQEDAGPLLAHARVGANMAEFRQGRGHDSSAKHSSSPSACAGTHSHAHGANFKLGPGARAQQRSTGANCRHWGQHFGAEQHRNDIYIYFFPNSIILPSSNMHLLPISPDYSLI